MGEDGKKRTEEEGEGERKEEGEETAKQENKIDGIRSQGCEQVEEGRTEGKRRDKERRGGGDETMSDAAVQQYFFPILTGLANLVSDVR